MDQKEARRNALELLESRRVIMVNGHLDTDNGDVILECLSVAYAKGYKEITLIINSGGGNSSVGAAIYNSIQLCTAAGMHVRGIVVSRCSSAAAVLFQACSSREVMNWSYMIIHWGRSSLNNIEQHAFMIEDESWVVRQIREDNEEMIEILTRKSQLTRDELFRLCLTEERLPARRMVALGLADRVVNASDLNLPKHMLVSEDSLH